MGASPEWILINDGSEEDEAWSLEAIYEGIQERLDTLGGVLVGGDLTEVRWHCIYSQVVHYRMERLFYVLGCKWRSYLDNGQA